MNRLTKIKCIPFQKDKTFQNESTNKEKYVHFTEKVYVLKVLLSNIHHLYRLWYSILKVPWNPDKGICSKKIKEAYYEILCSACT